MSEVRSSAGKLAEKAAIITGATGGIGEATARRFLDEGAKVMLVGRSQEKLAALAARLEAGERVATFATDAADEAGAEGAAAATAAAFGGVDILFANAGTEGRFASVDDVRFEDFEQTLRTNVLGAWASIKHCVAPMKARGGGSIIVTGSIASRVGFQAAGPYVASKHAVFGLVKCAALDLARYKIRVNSVAPGPIDNRMMRSIESQVSPDDPSAVYGATKDAVPLRRYGTNEEIAAMTTFLASDDASFCTGSIYMVDGGYITP